MKTTVILVCVVAIGVAPALAEKQETPANQDADRKAIGAAVESYVAAFNRGDAKALAAHWSPAGQYISRNTGERIRGREALEKDFAVLFADDKSERVDVTLSSLRFLTSDVAVEEGSTTITRRGELPTKTSYTAIHVKKNGKWLIDTIRETVLPAPSSNYDKLKKLEWMIGDWVDENGESKVEISCQWTKNKNFMTRSFRVKIKDRIDLEGTQVIGYDAAAGKIRSWVFDTDGGMGEGVWSQRGNRWLVQSVHTTSAGERGSSLNVISQIDADSFTWQSMGRELGRQILPDIDSVTVVRAGTQVADGR